MALPLTLDARNASEQTSKKPNIVLEIDGLTNLFGVLEIQKFVRIGDPGLNIGNFNIGGLNAVEGQSPLVSYQQGTTTNLTQSVNQDTGSGSTVTRYQVTLVDQNGEVTELLRPGGVLEDILGRRARVWFGFQSTPWPESYIVVHRGTIDDIQAGPGNVSLNVASSDKQAKQKLFLRVDTELTANMGTGDTVANVDDTTQFLEKITGPDGVTVDADFKTYIRINDELMEYNTKTPGQFQGLTRGQLLTPAASHSTGDTVSSYYRLGPANAIDLALKLLLGGREDFYIDEKPVTSFNILTPTDRVQNAIYFKEERPDIVQNIRVGDFVTITGASNSANNVNQLPIAGITEFQGGVYLILNQTDATLVDEINSTALISIRSQYDVWPSGAGVGLLPEEVDIAEFETLKAFFLSNADLDFRIEEEQDGKEFLVEQILNPISCYNLPRKAAISLGIHRPPLPTSNIRRLDLDSVVNASGLKVRRSTSKNFTNTVITKFDATALDTSEFARSIVRVNAESLERINAGNKDFTIESLGLRSELNAENIIQEASFRRLEKFKFGAESIAGCQVTLAGGFDIECGDTVLIDFEALQLSDSDSGTRRGEPRLFEVTNKTFNTKTGEIKLDLIDSSVDPDARYGLISPSAKIKEASGTQVIIKPSFNQDEFGVNEFRKWDNCFIGNRPGNNANVIIRSQDFSVVEANKLVARNGNSFTLETPISITVLEDYILEFDIYTPQSVDINLLYVFMNDSAFADSKSQYLMI